MFKGIQQLTHSHTMGPPLTQDNFYWNLHNGTMCFFQLDEWCILGCLKDRFPYMFDLSHDQNCSIRSVYQKWQQQGDHKLLWWKREKKIAQEQVFMIIKLLKFKKGSDHLCWKISEKAVPNKVLLQQNNNPILKNQE